MLRIDCGVGRLIWRLEIMVIKNKGEGHGGDEEWSNSKFTLKRQIN